MFYLSHVLLGGTVVFGLLQKKPVKPKNLKTFFKKPRFFQPCQYLALSRVVYSW